MPSPPCARQVLPPRNRPVLARGIAEINERRGRSTQEPRVRTAEFRQRGQMPAVIFVGMDGAFGGQEVKRCKLYVINGRDGPAVAPIGLDIGLGHVLASRVMLKHRPDLHTRLRRLRECLHRSGKPYLGGDAHRGILLPQQCLGLGRPGEQLAVEAEPIRGKHIPPAAPFDRTADAVEQSGFHIRIGEEAPAGPCVDHPSVIVRHAEAAAGCFGIAAHNHHRA